MLNKTFNANYFDGQSSKTHPVSVHFGVKEILFSTNDGTINKTVLLYELEHVRHIGNDRLILNFNAESTEGLDISAKDIVKQFSVAYPDISERHFLMRVKGLRNRTVGLLLGALLLLIVGIYFFVIPFVGELSTPLLSRENEIALGETIYKSVMAEYTIDTAQTRIVNEMVKQIDFKTVYPLKITVVDYQEKNAFALPGGHIVVFAGLLNKMNDHAELAALLAHEVSHINHQHSLRAMFRNVSNYIFISVIFSDVNGISTVIVDNARKFKTLSFSRKLEEEADREGLAILFHNQIDPRGMVRLFTVLTSEDHDVPEHFEFFSSHPLTQRRIKYINKQIEEQAFSVKKHPVLDSLWISLKADY